MDSAGGVRLHHLFSHKQWFLKITDIRDQMLDELDKVEWIPSWAGKVVSETGWKTPGTGPYPGKDIGGYPSPYGSVQSVTR